MNLKYCLLLLATYGVLAPTCFGNESTYHEEMVITGVRMNQSLTLETDPKLPRQPLPAHDGADYLKTIPGFSVIRKGGTGGDPVFRGMAGSRLSLLQDGDMILGGCGNRMDPPTAYIFPETYDRIRLIKGPQTVLYGPGSSAGVVLFERDRQRMEKAGWQVHGSLLGGSFGRNDEVLDILGGTPDFYLRGMASHSRQDDYQDGDGNNVHSRFDRWNATTAVGWTPSDKVTLEMSGSVSDAEAAYADRGMDGVRFDREHLNTKLIIENLTRMWQKLEAQAYYSDVDHLMDNFSLREPTSMMTMPMVYNPERETAGARVLITLAPTASAELDIGVDTQNNNHGERQSMNQMTMPYQQIPLLDTARFHQTGIFSEWNQTLRNQQRFVGGLRFDNWRARDKRSGITMDMSQGMMDPMMPMPNPTAGETRKDTLASGFLRYEKDWRSATYYAGVGRSERFPDFWELIKKQSAESPSAFFSKPETTTQLDIGASYKKNRSQGSISFFYNEISDYLLIQSGVEKTMGMMDSYTTSITRNIDARSWGAEADISYKINENWRAEASFASVRGTNKTDGTHLAQLPPLELRLGVYYNRDNWSAGVSWRAVDEQNRVDPGKGNIAGQDIGPSDNFNILSVNLGWRPYKHVLITGGTDNLLNETYAEHISRAGAMVAGFDQTTRVNEPGRTAWMKVQVSFK